MTMLLELPDLTIPDDRRGELEIPWNLAPWMYQGGAAINVRIAGDIITSGMLGEPIPERLNLVTKIHEALLGKVARGVSQSSLGNDFKHCRNLFAWSDENGLSLSLAEIKETYLDWSESLISRIRIENNLKAESGYNYASIVGSILDTILEREKPIVQITRLRKPKRKKTAQGMEADKQNLEWTFQFGFLLQDICDGLTTNVLWGSLPAKIPLRQGGVLENWSGLMPEQNRILARRDTPSRRSAAEKSDKLRAVFEADKTLRTRYPLANLRIMAEMMMFIGQTGMNLAQAHKLKLSNFHFSSYLDGYQVKRNFKSRKGGEVMFEVFQNYKPHFERYLDWRRAIFSESELLFPFVTFGRGNNTTPDFRSFSVICAKVEVKCIMPRMLRNTRINWLLRRSRDPDLTSEMAQHTKQTLLDVYERPSFQVAASEVTQFWSKVDKTNTRTIPAAPGECNGKPSPIVDIPEHATKPDCVQQSGCLWCAHHRDIDSQDYIWALTCFRHLKTIELCHFRGDGRAIQSHPASIAIDRIVEKLQWFRESNSLRKGWVDEGESRVNEGYYHPDWKRLIEHHEGVSV